jgi:hypothetical protein
VPYKYGGLMSHVLISKKWYIVTDDTVIIPPARDCPIDAVIAARASYLIDNPEPGILIINAENEQVARFLHTVYSGEDELRTGALYCEACKTYHIGPYLQQNTSIDSIFNQPANNE